MKLEKKEAKILEIKIILFFVFIALVLLFSIIYAPEIMKIIVNIHKFRDYIHSYGAYGVLIFILLQVAHIMIVFIPGEVIQIGGGFIYGTVFGTIYLFTGLIIGTVIVFFMTRLFGYSAIKIFLSPNKLEKFNYLMNDPKSEIIMFLLYLIPGIPKDTLTYIAGLTPIKPLRFLLLSSFARLPGILASCYIGANLQLHNYHKVIVVSTIAVILFVVGLIYKDRLINFIYSLKKRVKKTDNDSTISSS